MKIGESAAQQAQAAYRTTTHTTTNTSQSSTVSEASRVNKGDSAVISPQGQRYAFALHAVQSASDVRPDVVSKLHDQVQNGTYKIDEEKLANKLISPSGF